MYKRADTRQRPARRKSARSELQVDRKQGHVDRAKRHRPDFDFMPRHPFTPLAADTIAAAMRPTIASNIEIAVR
jgi:hypothetical protein